MTLHDCNTTPPTRTPQNLLVPTTILLDIETNLARLDMLFCALTLSDDGALEFDIPVGVLFRSLRGSAQDALDQINNNLFAIGGVS